MMQSFIGKQKEITVTVDDQKLAVNVKSGDLQVLATPALAALIEQAANELAASLIESDKTTVGTMISLEHKAPTIEGQFITAKACLTSIDGRKLTFNVSAYDKFGEVATGCHERFIVDRIKFMQKALSRAHEI